MLTKKQIAFANAVASGEYNSLSEAYKATYNANNMQSSAINKEASRLAAHPQISPMIEEKSRELERKKQGVMASHQISVQERVLIRLEELSTDAMPSDNVKLQATIALGKTVGMFSDKLELKQAPQRRNPEEIISSLIAKLEKHT